MLLLFCFFCCFFWFFLAIQFTWVHSQWCLLLFCLIERMALDCYDVMLKGSDTDGVYTIRPRGDGSPISAYCELSGQSGWLVSRNKPTGAHHTVIYKRLRRGIIFKPFLCYDARKRNLIFITSSNLSHHIVSLSKIADHLSTAVGIVGCFFSHLYIHAMGNKLSLTEV